ncbi:hypothetical protein VW35_02510 [Devosia soli]|uniref:Guanylate cyclase domain-containing protein n=1 Tax=Devosia soli TaxID=361041 RepID=A0A0F5LHM4_9HYPH|nr:hypothetical protein [Devosia soli]KKB81057.1 hypothetical protein VW35_02510 [Devosia soli]
MTIPGDTVNVASRIEGACKTVGYSILVSAAMVEKAHALATLPAGSMELKGRSGREAVFLLIGDETLRAASAFQALEASHATLLACLASGILDEEALARCQSLAPQVDPDLVRF